MTKESVFKKQQDEIPLSKEEYRFYYMEVMGMSEIDMNFLLAGSPELYGKKMTKEEINQFYASISSGS